MEVDPQVAALRGDDSRLIVEAFDADGRLVERYVGPSSAEQWVMHRRNECALTCSLCHQTLAEAVGEDLALRTMFERVFHKPAPW